MSLNNWARISFNTVSKKYSIDKIIDQVDYRKKCVEDWMDHEGYKMNEIDIKDQHGVELNNFFSNIKLNIIEKT